MNIGMVNNLSNLNALTKQNYMQNFDVTNTDSKKSFFNFLSKLVAGKNIKTLDGEENFIVNNNFILNQLTDTKGITMDNIVPEKFESEMFDNNKDNKNKKDDVINELISMIISTNLNLNNSIQNSDILVDSSTNEFGLKQVNGENPANTIISTNLNLNNSIQNSDILVDNLTNEFGLKQVNGENPANMITEIKENSSNILNYKNDFDKNFSYKNTSIKNQLDDSQSLANSETSYETRLKDILFAKINEKISIKSELKDKNNFIQTDLIKEPVKSKNNMIDDMSKQINMQNGVKLERFSRMIKVSDESSNIRGPILSQLEEKITLMYNEKTSNVTLELNPKELGKININMTFNKDGLVVEINAYNDETKKIIKSSIGELVSNLQKSCDTNVNVIPKDIENQYEKYFYGDQTDEKGQNKRQQYYEENNEDDEEESDLFAEIMNLRNLAISYY